MRTPPFRLQSDNRPKLHLGIRLMLMLAPQAFTTVAMGASLPNKPTALLLDSTITQVMANNHQPMSEHPNNSEAEDDGGEVDIGNDMPLPTTESPTPNPVPTPTTPQTPTVDLPPVAPNIAQVPLGAVSPQTVAKFVKLIDVVRQEYVNEVDDEDLFANAMMGTLTALDPYSEYLDKTAFENLRLFTEGDIGSIGVKVSYHDDVKAWVFDEVLANSPASQRGISQGNYLHQINDNKLTDEQTQQDVNQLLSGIAGTQVKLVVSDVGRRKHNVLVQRTLVEQQTMNARVMRGIAVVQIPVFQNTTKQQVLTALSALRQPFHAIVLDVRNNPGGVLSAANDVASLFMANKPVVQVKNRQGLQELIKTQDNPQFANIPLAILQNRYSASASEVLASSLQENNRAKIYGETSYGKGSIQSIIPLNDNEAVKLTVAHYYSGLGKKIDGVGVKSDYPLANTELYWENDVVNHLQQSVPTAQYRFEPSPATQAF
ncbi:MULTISPECIES: S41 family peptidase [unclassified Moraxella]|uniref:S41 family peptidase n=1 Tax=unclassified Moraxella TaxID=2685852 RepID=UPI003AF854CD